MSAKPQTGTLKVVLKPGDRAVEASIDVASAVRQLRSRFPRGLDTLFVGLANKSGFKVLAADKVVGVVLMGLLVPAIQKVRIANSAEQKALQSTLKPGGTLALVMSDGTVQHAQSGRVIIDCEGYAKLTAALL